MISSHVGTDDRRPRGPVAFLPRPRPGVSVFRSAWFSAFRSAGFYAFRSGWFSAFRSAWFSAFRPAAACAGDGPGRCGRLFAGPRVAEALSAAASGIRGKPARALVFSALVPRALLPRALADGSGLVSAAAAGSVLACPGAARSVLGCSAAGEAVEVAGWACAAG